MIKHELEIQDDDAMIRNKMIRSISQLSIGIHISLNIMKNDCFELKFLSLFENLPICDKIDNKKKEITLQLPVAQTLRHRKISQMLTTEEKEEVYNQIKDGVPIRDIIEIWQISRSTINRIVKDFQK